MKYRYGRERNPAGPYWLCRKCGLMCFGADKPEPEAGGNRCMSSNGHYWFIRGI